MLHPRKSLVYFLLIFFFFASISPVSASENIKAAQNENLSAGVKAAREGQYQSALFYFLKAKKSGLDSAGLSYNLAVSYYRLGQYPQAKKIFLSLSKVSESRQIAYFNLGLVANKQNKEAEAIKWFKRAYQISGEERIRAMSREALKRLGSTSANTFSWLGFVSVNSLYDSNVTLANDALTGISGTSDTAVQLIGNGSAWLKGDRRNGIRFSIGTYLQQYSRIVSNDFSQFNASLGQYNKWRNWRTQIHARWEDSYFGGVNYQQAYSLDSRARRALSGNEWLLTRYKLSRLQAKNTRFDYLGGWRHQMRLGALVRKKRYSITSYYQFEFNDRQDRVSSTGRFTSFSPARHLLRTRIGLKLNKQWRVSLDGSYRYSAYRGVNGLSDGSKIRRLDKQYRASAGLSHRFSSRWEINTRYSFTQNDSTIALYGYRRYQVLVGINATF